MDDYLRIPVVTRCYLTLIALTTLGCQLKLFSRFQLFFTWRLFWKEGQYWRLVTSYLYMGNLSIDTAFHLYFLLQYCQTLEEDSFRGKRADFVYFLLLSVVSLTTLSVIFDLSSEIPFLSSCLTFTLTYLWARRNPTMRMSFLGLITFNAPYLPWTLLGFSVLIHGVIPYADMLGFVVGHMYYYLEDVYPKMPASNGQRLLATPTWLINLAGLFGIQRQAPQVAAIPDLNIPAEENVGR